jgi:hypothetical protein
MCPLLVSNGSFCNGNIFREFVGGIDLVLLCVDSYGIIGNARTYRFLYVTIKIQQLATKHISPSFPIAYLPSTHLRVTASVR